MKPTVSTPSEAYDEEAVEIKMEGVTLEQLIQYLYQVENSPQFMKIKRLHVAPRRDNRQILSAIFRVSTFTPKEGTS
jgi:general secretion pathway protein M